MVPMRGGKTVEAFHQPGRLRDIALRCPRPRSSGRHHCAAERGADGAARRPYQVQGFNARNFSGKPLQEPEHAPSRSAAATNHNFVAADVRRLITPNPKSEIDQSLLTSAATVPSFRA